MVIKPVAPVAYHIILEPGIGQFREFESRQVHTSWAGQDAQNKPISLCPAQFFDFGPEILTRNLEQAR